MKKLLLSLFIFASVTAGAQTKLDNIRRLIDITTKGQIGQSLTTLMLSAYKTQYPQVDSSFWRKLEPQLNMDALFRRLIPVYDKYYSDQDVKNILAFYDTPTGKVMISSLPQIMQESSVIGREWGMEMNTFIADKLKAAGYAPPAHTTP